MSELRFEIDGAEAANAEIARAMVTTAASRGLKVYAHARSALASLAAAGIGLALGHFVWWLATGRLLPYLGGLAAIFLGLMIWRAWALRAVRKHALITAQRSPLLSGAQTWTFDDDGVRIRTAMSDSRIAWGAFDRVQSGPSSIGLVSGNVFFAMPVAGAAARDTLVERIEAWMRG